VIADRCHQARVRNALEPEWEARFEPRSYGFRPGRGCHDAIESLFHALHGKGKRVWILDADLAAAFGSLDHEVMLATLAEKIRDGRFLQLVSRMLKAGYLDDWTWHATLSGSPQGGIATPPTQWATFALTSR
jgi:RNA-directed DNA polymerase